MSARLMLFLLLLAGCASAPHPADPLMTVEGRVSVRGNEPFPALVLETDEHNSYVLNLDESERAALQNRTPGRFRVVGTLYKDDWNGRPFAHLRVTEWEEAP